VLVGSLFIGLVAADRGGAVVVSGFTSCGGGVCVGNLCGLWF
jgi:hypothetical protein